MSQDVFDSMATLLAAHGLTADDLAEYVRSRQVDAQGAAPTVADHVRGTLQVLAEGTARGYRTHFMRLVDGVGQQCSCTCEQCLDDFEKDGVCHNRCGRCRDRLGFEAAGERVLREGCFTRTELERLAVIAERMSVKKAHLDNRRRARQGLAAKPVHGQGGREMCVSALRCLFERAIPDHLRTNPAEKIKKGNRSESRRRSLTDEDSPRRSMWSSRVATTRSLTLRWYGASSRWAPAAVA